MRHILDAGAAPGFITGVLEGDGTERESDQPDTETDRDGPGATSAGGEERS